MSAKLRGVNTKELLGLCSLVLGSVGYVPYIKQMLRRQTMPHAYSWLTWAVLATVAFGVQAGGKGGPGAWLQALTAVATFSIFLLSLRYGHKDIQLADKISLFFAGVAFVLWLFTNQPLAAAILISIIEAAGGFFPTFRKSYNQPYEETAISYLTYATSVPFSIAALENYSAANIVYPVAVLFLNASAFVFLMVRRYQVSRLPKRAVL